MDEGPTVLVGDRIVVSGPDVSRRQHLGPRRHQQTAEGGVVNRDVALSVFGATHRQRFGEPSDIANACAWLVSEDSSYVTGQTIGVNGGRVVS